MTNVGSLSVTGNTVFNLDTQAGITHLLASIRLSEINTEHKSELRDLVFLYTNGGKDQTVRLALEQKIVAYQLTVAPQKVVAPILPPTPTIGAYRPAPSFHTPVTQTAVIPALVPNFTETPAWHPTPVSEPTVASTIPDVEVAAQPNPVLVTPPPAPISIPVVPAVAVTEDPQYLKRIREIKALVNEKVGNPVNLVDINNEVGREYMGALLDAMKKLNSGSSAASAMQRLEEAYIAVEEALKQHGKDVAVPRTTVSDTPIEIVGEVLLEPEVVETTVEEAPTAWVSQSPVTSVPVNTIRPVAVPVVSVSTPNVSFLEETPLPRTGTFYTETGALPHAQQTSFKEPVTAWTVQPENKPVLPAAQFSSLADNQEKSPAAEISSSMPLKTSSVAGDPLFTQEVDDGLQQLLLEWPIFKKSGVFGAGPKGREHPLFKKMSPLQIPLLLAGRFEGATQDIKQSVTDYMNGWRYEQGLIYQQAETFEHYLRRVIRHILDLQKGK